MILYIDATGKYVAKQDEARKAGKGWHQVEVPTTDGRQALADYLNALRWSEQKQMAVTDESDKFGIDVAEIAARDGVAAGDKYLTPATNHKPAFTQAQVDEMFSGKSDEGPLPNVDVVCHAISEMRGPAIGHVAHELAARIEILAKGMMVDKGMIA